MRLVASIATVIFWSMCSFALSGDMDYYKNQSTYHMSQPRECDREDVGRIQVSCKYIEVGHISGYLSVSERRDPRWPRLEKYWDNTDKYLKFAAVACARGSDENAANKLAMNRSYRLVQDELELFEEKTFTGLLKNAGYRKADGGWKCIKTENTSGAGAVSSAPSVVAPPRQDAQEQERKARERAQAQADAAARANTATFIITSKDRYSLGLEFYSQTRRNHVWPGNNKQYILSGTKTYNLGCVRGEKICFGAWRDYQTIYWGAGRDGRKGCERCCTTCGSTFETTLSDGGADSYPQTSGGGGGGQALNTIIGVLGVGAAIANGLNSGGGGGGGTYTPTPRRNAPRQSGISGN